MPDEAEFWVAFYADNSSIVVVRTELAALRHAVANSMQVRRANWGEELRV
jgi:hypothetical protein